MKYKNVFLWVMAVILTLTISIYQRITGPTKPVRGKVSINDKTINYKLLRTEVSGTDAQIKFETKDEKIGGALIYKRYKSYDAWDTLALEHIEGFLTASIPTQPAAGKVMYRIVLTDQNNSTYPLTEEPVVIRFKGDVPAFYLIPHIIFMFTSLLLAFRSLIQSIFVRESFYYPTLLTFIALVLGGLIFGPIVQKYAFGAYWTGFPFGHDLTDNKTAISVIFWGIALYTAVCKRKSTRWWVLAAAIVLLATYLIPHSVLGSELDYTKI